MRNTAKNRISHIKQKYSMHILLDESGDLGFDKKGASKYLVITLVIPHDLKRFERRMVRVKREGLKKKYRRKMEFKKEREEVARPLLRQLTKENFDVYTIVCNKERVKQEFRTQKEILYTYIASLVLLSLDFKDHDIVVLLVDRRSSKRIILQNFDAYLKSKIDALQKGIRIMIEHRDSQLSPGLQATDFVTWAIWRKYEKEDINFYSMIKSKIVAEKRLFFEQQKTADPGNG